MGFRSALRGAPAAFLVLLGALLPVSAQEPIADHPSFALPSAPEPTLTASAAAPGESSSRPSQFDLGLDPALADGGFGVTPETGERVPLSQCPFDETGARECRVHWRHVLIEASAYNAFQDAGNLYTGYWYRWMTTHGKWMDRWFDSVLGWRWDHWNDDNPYLDQYVGHPMMGSITNYLWIQNDPKGMTLEFSNTRPYWRSRMRAMAFSTAFSFQWKFGPFGEAGVGHNGDHYFPDHRVRTNETGWVELVTTPVGGLGWTVLEDVIDKHLRPWQQKPHKPAALILAGFLTPSRSIANLFRFRAPWYRDGYVVKANSFWSDPDSTRPTGGKPQDEIAPGDITAMGAPAAEHPSARPLPEWPHYGGVHEFGTWWGLSLFSTDLWGTHENVRYMPIKVNYSYLLNRNGDRVSFRYEPEVTALAMLDESNPRGKNKYTRRTRTYGAGLSPAGLRVAFLPNHPVEPFLSTHAGFLAFTDPVLLPKGSPYLYTVDFGGGFSFFRTRRQSVSIGYRYQHLAPFNGSDSTDANTVYLQVSRFRTGGYR